VSASASGSAAPAVRAGLGVLTRHLRTVQVGKDLDGDGTVNAADLATLLGAWSRNALRRFSACDADLNGDASRERRGPRDPPRRVGDRNGGC
jgi:hypothetical protein